MEQIKPEAAVDLPPIAIALPTPKRAPPQRDSLLPKQITKLALAREVVRRCLLKEFAAREVRMTKIGPSAGEAPGWYAEAEILVPDLGIKTLGLPLTQEVLERELCAVDLDADMAVRSYEVFDPRDR
jgi:hypothetical protein